MSEREIVCFVFVQSCFVLFSLPVGLFVSGLLVGSFVGCIG